MIVVSTSSKRTVLDDMGMSECFSGELYLPNIQSVDEIASVMKQLALFPEDHHQKAVEMLRAMGADQKLSIGIKKLLMLIEMARQAQGQELEKFIDSMQEHVGRS